MNHYKKALERIQKECGKVCKQYEICEHEACQSSYNAWAIADEALGETTYPAFKLLITISVIIIAIFTIAILIETHHDKKVIMELNKKIESLEIRNEEIVNAEIDHYRLRKEFETYKQMTSDEFVRTWESFGIIRQNFLALGTGGVLCDEDIMSDESDEQEKE